MPSQSRTQSAGLSIDTSNSLWQPLFELKNKDEWEESFHMSQKEEQFGDKVVKTMAPLVFLLVKIDYQSLNHLGRMKNKIK